MKVLIVADIETGGVFIDEFVYHLKQFTSVEVSIELFLNKKSKFDVIHIHWPEYIFNWQLPTLKQIQKLKDALIFWKKRAKIVVTRHNYHPHSGQNKQFEELYTIVYSFVDLVIHLGEFSKQEYLNRYRNYDFIKTQLHEVIFHPYFISYPNVVSKIEAREKLNIKLNSIVFLVFGKIRNKAEKNYILDFFEKVSFPNKLLLVPRWYSDKRPSIKKTPLKWIKWYFNTKNLLNNPNLLLFNNFIENDEAQFYFNAADFVFLPRLNSLNSGVIPLAFLFNKVVISLKQGNITEMLKNNRGVLLKSTKKQEIKQQLKEAMKNKEIIEEKTEHFAKEYLDPNKLTYSIFKCYNKLV